MAGLKILVSIFAVGAFAKRLKKEAVANGAGILPGQAALPLRSAVMSPRAGAPVGMAMPKFGNPGKYWKGAREDALSKVSMQLKIPDNEPEEEMAMMAEEQMMQVQTINSRKAYDSLSRDIPKWLQFESQAKTPIDWDIYTDDLVTDFKNINLVDSAAMTLFSAVAAKHVPLLGSIKGKDGHVAALQELHQFIEKFATKSEVTGQDECMDENMDWCVIMEDVSGLDPELAMYEGDPVISSKWKMKITMNTELESHPEATVTIEGFSRFHMNEVGMIYRHSIDEYFTSTDLNEEQAKLFLERLANAPRVAKSQVVDVDSLDEKQEKKRGNIRQAYASLENDIPSMLQFDDDDSTSTPMDWSIYTDDVQLDFAKPNISEALKLWGAVAVTHVPSWGSAIKGKAPYKKALQELRVFVANFVDKADMTGQDWCTAKDSENWGCVIEEILSGIDPELAEHEGDEVITSNWKMSLTLKDWSGKTKEAKFLDLSKDRMKGAWTLTIQGTSRFHLNEVGKIYRHSIDGYTAGLDEDIQLEESKLFLTRLANAPQASLARVTTEVEDRW